MLHINWVVFIAAALIFFACYVAMRLLVRSHEQYPGQSGDAPPWWGVALVIMVLALFVQAFWDGIFYVP